jgi:hypothetical protein
VRVITVYADLMKLKESNDIPAPFLEYLEQEWNGLYEALSNGEERGEFSLKAHGKQIVLEPGDRIPEGIGESYWPEYVDRIRLEGMEVYRMYVMETEDYGNLYYSIVGTLDEESEMILREYAGEN